MATKKSPTNTVRNARRAIAKADAIIAKAGKRAPGNAKALADKAADNAARIAKQAGRAECVKSAVQMRTGNGILVTTSRDRNIVVARVDRRINELTKLGLPVAPLEEYLKVQPKPEARMARGTDAHTAPHSAKAVADQKRTGKAVKTAAPKAGKNKTPSKGAERDYTVGKTAVKAKADTWRGYMLNCIRKHTNTAKAKAAHAKSGKFSSNKLDFNWAAAQGYINWAK